MNGKTATIGRGTSFFLPATENIPAKEIEAKLSLNVTPTISYNNYVTLHVVLEDKKKEGDGTSGKNLETTLLVKSGETIVLGGIYKEDNSKSENGIPGLRRIPFFGWLFKAQRKTITKTELLIFLTPSVLPSGVKS